MNSGILVILAALIVMMVVFNKAYLYECKKLIAWFVVSIDYYWGWLLVTILSWSCAAYILLKFCDWS